MQNETRVGYILIDAYRAEAAMSTDVRRRVQLNKAADKMELLTKLHQKNK